MKTVRADVKVTETSQLHRAVAKELDNKADGNIKELLDETTHRNDGTGSVGNSGESCKEVQKQV